MRAFRVSPVKAERPKVIIILAADYPEVVAMLQTEAERVRGELGDVGKKGSDQRPGWPPAE